MTSYVENEINADFPFDAQHLIELVAESAFRSEQAPVEKAFVNVLITDSEGIREYNRQYRDIDRETDVLSFPNFTFETPGVFEIPEGSESDYLDPDTGEIWLGDIILCADRIRSQAREYGHSEKREMAFLVAHSALHLCGYDHETPQEAAVMEEKQEAILQKLGITRDGGLTG
ncbi:MAG: rRNA maturation RNase YbeY [Lachnospiraceae bacterium]|nr:rRNA maturation RNase YbeY [Lachnospiraceae bacterium]